MDESSLLLRDAGQTAVQERLLHYQISPRVAKNLAQDTFKFWSIDDIDGVFCNVQNITQKHHRFLTQTLSHPDPSSLVDNTFVRPAQAQIEQAARDHQALCINADGQWSLRSDGYVVVSHVWEEGIQTDELNRGLPTEILRGIFNELRNLDISWLWLDCLAIARGLTPSDSHQESLTEGFINNFATIYRCADAVVVFDALTMRLQPRDVSDVAVILACGKWMTRLWCLQEILLSTKRAIILTAGEAVEFKDMVRALRYLYTDVDEGDYLLGPHDPAISQTLRVKPDVARFGPLFNKYFDLMMSKGEEPSLVTIARLCLDRQTGNDIDNARAFFPLFGLDWSNTFGREEGINALYDSQFSLAKRLVLMYGSPRLAFRRGWAPSYLSGLTGPSLQPNDPLGEIEYTTRGLSRWWQTYKLTACDTLQRQNTDALIASVQNPDGSTLRIACRIDARETQKSRDSFQKAVLARNAYLLSNCELSFPTSNGLAINTLLVEQDTECTHINEAWVYFVAESTCADGVRTYPDTQEWLLLHENPTSQTCLSGKDLTRRIRKVDPHGRKRMTSVARNAAMQGDLQELEIYLRLIPSLRERNEQGHTLLHSAVILGDHDIINKILDRRASVDAQDNDGRTPLNLACEGGDEVIVETLLTVGADPNLNPNNASGCLNQAIQGRNYKIMKLLISYGADVNKKDGLGRPPLFAACKYIQFVRYLIKAGADPKANLVGSAKLIHFAARKGATLTVQLLINLGVAIDEREGESGASSLEPTALYRAISERREITADCLLSHGANPNLRFKDSKTCVHLAAETGSYKILRYILIMCVKYGHSLSRNDVCSPNSWTALHLAAKGGHKHAVWLLMRHGWQATARDAQGRTPASLALQYRHMRMAMYLVTRYVLMARTNALAVATAALLLHQRSKR